MLDSNRLKDRMLKFSKIKGANLRKVTRRLRRIWVLTNLNMHTYNLNLGSIVEQLNKAFVGVVAILGAAYRTQVEFVKHGCFDVKVTPMGVNLVLLEEEVEGAMNTLLSEVWISEWFDEVRSWSPREIDNERLVWLRVFGVPAHAWSTDFFAYLVSGIGEFVSVDDNTSKKTSMDVARVLYKTKVHDLVSRLVKVNIGGMCSQ